MLAVCLYSPLFIGEFEHSLTSLHKGDAKTQVLSAVWLFWFIKYHILFINSLSVLFTSIVVSYIIVNGLMCPYFDNLDLNTLVSEVTHI